MARIDEEFRRPAGADPFDVLCVGDATMTFVPSVPARPSPFGDVTESFREGGGATRAAMALGRRDAKVGLVTTLRDDRAGRHLVDDLRHACVDTRAVRLAVPEKSLLFVTGTGGARQVASLGEDVDPVVVPPGWSTKVLLLSGLSPSTGYAASLCAAARSARKRGTIVVLDVNARRSRWAGHDVRRTT
ncbi:MAG: PfkB family carbohydrate kinase [Polyangiaceae bacterium]